MIFEYSILTTVYFKHYYFTNNKLPHLVASPSTTCAAIMNNNKMLFKPFKDGFHILYESKVEKHINDKKELLNNNQVLRFTIQLADEYFYNYTSDFATDITEYLFYFNNQPNTNGNTLHQDEFVSNKDMITPAQLGGSFFTKPFAVVDIWLNETLQSEYSIVFKEKISFWRYLVVSNHIKDLKSLAILDGENNVFKPATNLVLPNGVAAICLESIQAYSLQQIQQNSFKLVEDFTSNTAKYKVVIKTLPTPNIKTISNTIHKTNTNKNFYSEIFI